MKQFLCWLAILLVISCKEKYNAPVHSPATGYLVVDGVVNSVGTASLTLSRSTSFDSSSIVYEAGDLVTVQGSDSSIFILQEMGNGVYSANNVNLNNSINYRLRITASNGEQFISDFVPVKNNPPIDSISWTYQNDGVHLYINTHDPQNNTRYYQWFYDEAWEFHSPYVSDLKYMVTQTPDGMNVYSVVYRDSTKNYDTTITKCWQFYSPTNIFLGSTAKLSKDVVYLPLDFIPKASIQLSVLFSIHLKQYAWTEDGYEFLQKMQKNTEENGTIFDAQPSELIGNIHSVTNPAEPVIGFFNVCPVQEMRIYIDRNDVPNWGYLQTCSYEEVENNNDSIQMHALGWLPTQPVKLGNFGSIEIFGAATPVCVDCTLSGTNKRPSYWPQ